MQPAFNSILDIINKINFKEGRDLAYLLLSPSLLDTKDVDLFQFPQVEDYLLDKISEMKFDLLNTRRKEHRLGKYMESLLLVYFKHCPDFNLIASLLQLQDGNSTKGEIDFIVESVKDDTNIHLEVALKYYLQYDADSFIGPNGNDTLREKIKKLITHQLKLCSNYRQLLPEKLQALELIPKLFLRGSLFYKLQDWMYKKEHNIYIEGWWCRRSELDLLTDTVNHVVEKRKDWIYPFAMLTSSLNFDEFKKQAEMKLSLDGSLMIVRSDKKGNVLDRGFLVSEYWPNPSKSHVY